MEENKDNEADLIFARAIEGLLLDFEVQYKALENGERHLSNCVENEDGTISFELDTLGGGTYEVTLRRVR